MTYLAGIETMYTRITSPRLFPNGYTGYCAKCTNKATGEVLNVDFHSQNDSNYFSNPEYITQFYDQCSGQTKAQQDRGTSQTLLIVHKSAIG